MTSVQFLDCSSIILVMTLSYFLLKTRYNLFNISGCFLSLIGIFICIWFDIRSRVEDTKNSLYGDAMVIVGCSMYGISNICQEYTVKHSTSNNNNDNSMETHSYITNYTIESTDTYNSSYPINTGQKAIPISDSRYEFLAYYGILGFIYSLIEMFIFDRKATYQYVCILYIIISLYCHIIIPYIHTVLRNRRQSCSFIYGWIRHLYVYSLFFNTNPYEMYFSSFF